MIGAVRVPQPIEVLFGGGVALACGLEGQVLAGRLHGFFAADTRVLSTYRFSINGNAWELLGRSRSGHGTAQWEFQNPRLRDPLGDIPAGRLLLSLRRRLDGALHDDLRLCAFHGRRVRLRLTLQLDADFADIFEVKRRSTPPRLNVRRMRSATGGVFAYERRGFQRALHFQLFPTSSTPQYVGAQIIFELNLAPGDEWRCCLDAEPEIDGRRLTMLNDPHVSEPDSVEEKALMIRTAPILEQPFQRGRMDLKALAVPGSSPQHHLYTAAGVPWFLALFGRDTLITALMAGIDGMWSAQGALEELGLLQAVARDDWRDAEPGKLPHEIRRGELASTNVIPHGAYYGAHDVPALYCLTLWHAWRWSGDRALLRAHLPTARLALRWCDEMGDRDGDGLQEYATRSSAGYYNQSWKDSGEAIVHEDGRLAPLPLATVELQGYLFAARLAMAELLTEEGDVDGAARLRRSAHDLRVLVERRFWLDEVGFYAMALDGEKRVVRSVSSNPGHLLWCGLPQPERAAQVAARLVAPELFSGWGLRTLTTRHPAYNPLSYQLGSVWPHDTVLAAAGLWRYGHYDEAGELMRAILEAATAFEEERLPELFCGLDRSHGLPVPYEEANSPQAWAAAAPLLIAQTFLGLIPDAPRGRCFISPHLPTWLPHLELRGIAIGQGSLDIVISRRGPRTVIDEVIGKDIEVLEETIEAPLWGRPPFVP